METTSTCRTDRVSASIPIQVSWIGRTGEHFDALAKTLTISRSAATIAIPQKLAAVREITVHCVGTDRSGVARVVGLIGQEDGWHIYGVSFIDSNVNLWDIELPPALEPENAKSSLFLECAFCLARAWVELDEIQTEVFKARGIINLNCDPCASWTVWGLASQDGPSKSAGERVLKSMPAPVPRTVNDRKHVRVNTKMNACVRSGVIVDEVVRVKDVSRGGFRFVSTNYYPDDAQIMVAIPYTRDTSNVFVPARVIWRREIPRLKRYEYGVTYSSSPNPTRAN